MDTTEDIKEFIVSLRDRPPAQWIPLVRIELDILLENESYIYDEKLKDLENTVLLMHPIRLIIHHEF